MTSLLQAFEHLIDLQLVFPASGSSAHHQLGSRITMKEHRLMVLRVDENQIKAAVKTYPNCPTDLSRWGLSESIRT